MSRRTPALRTKIIATVAASLLLIGAALGWALTRRSPTPVEVDPTITLRTPGVLVRDTETGQLALLKPDGSRTQAKVACSRAYAAGGQGICLQRDPTTPNTFQLAVLDDRLNVVEKLPLVGVPTRARVSADGRMLSWTIFVNGDSYLDSGFSTRTGILDRETGALVDTIEDFTLADRKLPVDANFWGVSFTADDNTFYATMSTGKHLYLVQGSVATESLEILADGVECPSLSPDDTRIVYKKRLPDLTWQLWVMDLTTQVRTQLAEPGNVDDQAAWLDDRTIAYGKLDPTTGRVDLWSVPADGSGTPAKLAEGAESPAVLLPA